MHRRSRGSIRYSIWISTGPSSGSGSTAIARSGSCTPGVTSASSPMRSRTRRLTASSSSIVPAAAASAMRVPASDASHPQSALPSAMLACTAMRFIATGARAHPRRRRGLRPGRQAGEHAGPRGAGAARADERDRRDSRPTRRAASPTIHSRMHDGDHRVERRPLQAARNQQRADDGADAEAAPTACRSRRRRARAGRGR